MERLLAQCGVALSWGADLMRMGAAVPTASVSVITDATTTNNTMRLISATSFIEGDYAAPLS
jgi:hypothetical protein